MTKKNKILLAAAAAVAVVLLVACLLIFGGRGGETGNKQTAATSGTPVEYTVELRNDTGMPLEGVGIYVYTDETQAELVWFARTNGEGKITFRDVTCEGYIAVLDGVSSDYTVEAFYPLTGETTTIVVNAQMQAVSDLAGVTRELGDIMFDFTVTSVDGTEYTLSELLKEKDAVVLNFWYMECAPCRQEFPYLQEAYEAYSDRIEVLAMNPMDGTEEEIAAFKKDLELSFPIFKCDPEWASAMQLKAYPTTVIIDRFGMVSLIHTGSITSAKVFTDAFAHFTAEDYVQGVVEDIMDLETEVPGSDPSDPIELGGVQSFQVSIPAGGKMYYHLYRVNGYLSLFHDTVYAIYNDRTYGPQAGGFGFNVKSPDTYTPAVVVFGNSGTEDVTVTVNIAKPMGIFDNPYAAKLGEFATTVNAGNDQGVWYQITAPSEGYLTIECLESTPGVKYDYTMQNLRSGRVNSISEDGNADGTMVSLKVVKGDGVKIQVATKPDSSGTYPAGKFKTKLFMSDTPVTEETEQAAKLDYAVTVTNEKREPISGVHLSVQTSETKPTPLTTDENGVAHAKLEVGTYPVTLTLPIGYTAATTEFVLTEARPVVSIKLDTEVVEMTTYTITVLNEDGTPAEGLSVMIGSTSVVTDENGQAVFELPVGGGFTVTVSRPDGTVQNATIPEGETELTITLEEGSGAEDPNRKVTYTVKLVSYSGDPLENVTVQFLEGKTPVAVQKSDSTGTVTAKLPVGEYKLSLAFSGKKMYYEDSNAVVSESRPYLVLRLTDNHSSRPEDTWFGPSYNVTEGALHVDMPQTNIITYFIFEPTRSGVYRITASDPQAQLSYWGGNMNFLIQQEINGGVPTNTHEINVKDSHIGNSYIYGVTGVKDVIFEIEWVKPAILDDTDMEWIVYQGNRPTKNYSVSASKKFTYVDLTGKTSAFTPVMGSDGYYHLNSATGPVLHVNLGPNARYISLYNMLGLSGTGGTRFGRHFYDANGKLEKKEDYTECMISYIEHRGPQTESATYQVYPLTEDLMYMLKNGGEDMGWWDTENENSFLFGELGNAFNPELGWMFAVCY